MLSIFLLNMEISVNSINQILKSITALMHLIETFALAYSALFVESMG